MSETTDSVPDPDPEAGEGTRVAAGVLGVSDADSPEKLVPLGSRKSIALRTASGTF